MGDRQVHAERLANACPRFPDPSCDLETEEENIASATIWVEGLAVSFGVVDVMVEIDGRPDDWSVAMVQIPADGYAFRECSTDPCNKYDRDRWEIVDTERSFAEREIWRSVREWVTDDIAAEYLLASIGDGYGIDS